MIMHDGCGDSDPNRTEDAYPDMFIHFMLTPLDGLADVRARLHRTLRVTRHMKQLYMPFRHACCTTTDALGMLGPVRCLVVLYDSQVYNGAERVLQTMHHAGAERVIIVASNALCEGKLLATARERPLTADRIEYHSPLAWALRSGSSSSNSSGALP